MIILSRIINIIIIVKTIFIILIFYYYYYHYNNYNTTTTGDVNGLVTKEAVIEISGQIPNDIMSGVFEAISKRDLDDALVSVFVVCVCYMSSDDYQKM